jgi:hypothetical protein
MPCSTPGCARTPRWRPSLDLRSRKDGSPTRLTFVRLAYCDEDKEKAKLETFLSDEGFSKIARHLRERGKEVPVQKLTSGWIPRPDLLSHRGKARRVPGRRLARPSSAHDAEGTRRRLRPLRVPPGAQAIELPRICPGGEGARRGREEGSQVRMNRFTHPAKR